MTDQVTKTPKGLMEWETVKYWENTWAKVFDMLGCCPVSYVSLSLLSPSQSVLFSVFLTFALCFFYQVQQWGITTVNCSFLSLFCLYLYHCDISLFYFSLTLSGAASLSLHPFPFILCCSTLHFWMRSLPVLISCYFPSKLLWYGTFSFLPSCSPSFSFFPL